MLKVGIIGASGYTGVELARILSTHPEVELTVATSRQYAGKPLSEVFPNLRKRVELVCENPELEELAASLTVSYSDAGDDELTEVSLTGSANNGVRMAKGRDKRGFRGYMV